MTFLLCFFKCILLLLINCQLIWSKANVCNSNTMDKDAAIILSPADEYYNSETLLSFQRTLNDDKLNFIKEELSYHFAKTQLGVTPYANDRASHRICSDYGLEVTNKAKCECYIDGSVPLTEGKLSWKNRPEIVDSHSVSNKSFSLFSLKHCYTNPEYNLFNNRQGSNQLSVVVLFVDNWAFYDDDFGPILPDTRVVIGRLARDLKAKKISVVVLVDQRYTYWILMLMKLGIESKAIAKFDPQSYIDDILRLIKVSMCGASLNAKNYFYHVAVNDELGKLTLKTRDFYKKHKLAVSLYFQKHVDRLMGTIISDLYQTHTNGLTTFYETLQLRYPNASLSFYNNKNNNCTLYKSTMQQRVLKDAIAAENNINLSENVIKNFEKCHGIHNPDNYTHVIFLFGRSLLNTRITFKNSLLEKFFEYCVKRKISIIYITINDEGVYNQTDLLDQLYYMNKYKIPKKNSLTYLLPDLMNKMIQDLDYLLKKADLEYQSCKRNNRAETNEPKFSLEKDYRNVDIFYVIPEKRKPLLNSYVYYAFGYEKQQDLRKTFGLIKNTSINFGWLFYPTYEDYILFGSNRCLPEVRLHSIYNTRIGPNHQWLPVEKKEKSPIPLMQIVDCLTETTQLDDWRTVDTIKVIVLLTDDKPITTTLLNGIYIFPLKDSKKKIFPLRNEHLASTITSLRELLEKKNIHLIIMATPDTYDDWLLAVNGWEHVTVTKLESSSSVPLATIDAIEKI